MAIELKQQLRLTQQLVMTPQLQQAIKLLQLNQLELVNAVEQELQENPILEEEEQEEQTSAEREDISPGEDGAEGSADDVRADAEKADAEPSDEPRELTDTLEVPDFTADESSSSESSESADGSDAEGPSDVDKIADVEWDDYMDSHPQTGLEGRVNDSDGRPSLEATLTRRESLADHLMWQIHLSDFSPEEVEIAEWIIGNLDDKGYLCSTLDEIAKQAGADESRVDEVLQKVQRLDPKGVAARDLRECLMLQIELVPDIDPLVVKVVDEHLDLLQKRNFRELIRLLGVTAAEIAAAARAIGQFEPRPGRNFGGDDPVYIVPDIYVYKVGDEFHVLLNEDGLPKLKINNVYKDILAKSGAPADSVRDTKNYVREKVRSAMWLIRSIHQRQRTIYKVMESIISYQSDFFEMGIQHLKPLNLRDVADDIEMHESTVSRVTTNKYVHTPQGIFELKYFFNSSINRFQGEAVASESVKENIRTIITNEDPIRPISDQRIAEMLKSANIDIARRTVTKYREAMNILSSTKRRQVG